MFIADFLSFISFSALLFFSNFSDPTLSLAIEINLDFVMWGMAANGQGYMFVRV
jgi:hypothetical protein